MERWAGRPGPPMRGLNMARRPERRRRKRPRPGRLARKALSAVVPEGAGPKACAIVRPWRGGGINRWGPAGPEGSDCPRMSRFVARISVPGVSLVPPDTPRILTEARMSGEGGRGQLRVVGGHRATYAPTSGGPKYGLVLSVASSLAGEVRRYGENCPSSVSVDVLFRRHRRPV